MDYIINESTICWSSTWTLTSLLVVLMVKEECTCQNYFPHIQHKTLILDYNPTLLISFRTDQANFNNSNAIVIPCKTYNLTNTSGLTKQNIKYRQICWICSAGLSWVPSGYGWVAQYQGYLSGMSCMLVWSQAEFKSKISQEKKQKGFFKTTRNISAKSQWSRSWMTCLSWMLKKNMTCKKSKSGEVLLLTLERASNKIKHL